MTARDTTQTHRPPYAEAAFPAVHFGTLEDLLEEMGWPHRSESAGAAWTGSFQPIFRVTTQYFHLPTGAGVKYNTVKLIVTALAQLPGDPFPHSYVWVWQVDDYETWQGRVPPGREWRLAHTYALLEAALGKVRALISNKTGLEVRRGMYCVPAAYHDIVGTTALIDLADLRAGIRAQVPELPDELIPRAMRVREHLYEAPGCEDARLLQLFWGDAAGSASDERSAVGAQEELQQVLAYIAFLDECFAGRMPAVQKRGGN